jgi:hypothetical protein
LALDIFPHASDSEMTTPSRLHEDPVGDDHGVIRQAAVADTELLRELIAEFYAVDGHPYDDATVRTALVPLLAGPEPRPGVVWLILEAGAVVGYAVVTWGYSIESGGCDALLDELYVRA